MALVLVKVVGPETHTTFETNKGKLKTKDLSMQQEPTTRNHVKANLLELKEEVTLKELQLCGVEGSDNFSQKVEKTEPAEIRSERNANGKETEAYTRAGYGRASKKARRTERWKVVKLEVGGGYVVPRKQNCEDFDRPYLKSVPHDYIHITHGTAVVQDKDTGEIVLVVKCIPFEDMKPEEFKEYEELTSSLISMKLGASRILNNSAFRTGEMNAAGWRGGSKIEDIADLHNWEEQQTSLLLQISSFGGKCFCQLAPSLYKRAQMEVTSAGVPTLVDTKFNILSDTKLNMLSSDKSAFSSNITYTINDFSNSFHRDNDFSTYAFGIWAPISSKHGKLESKKGGFCSKRSEFLLGSCKICVDFNKCDGIVQILWRGKTDLHCTLLSSTSLGFTRIGSSLQVNFLIL